LSGEQRLWQAYRDAFRQFQREATRLAEIKAQPSYNPVETEMALLRVEHARLAYNDARDVLAASLMPTQYAAAFWSIPASSRQGPARVKNIAALLWEMAGKPQGSADDDWYRAERVVRGASAQVCCY
jgi:hypothetical protein